MRLRTDGNEQRATSNEHPNRVLLAQAVTPEQTESQQQRRASRFLLYLTHHSR